MQLSGGVLDVTKLKYFTSGEFGQRVRYWDFAATEQKEGVDPDWTAGVLMGVEDGEYQVQDVQGSAWVPLKWRFVLRLRRR